MGSQSTTRSNIALAAITSGAFLITAYFGSFLFFEKRENAKRLPPVNIVTFSDLPADVKLSATITMGQKTSDVLFIDNTLRLPPEQEVHFNLPYQLKATLRTSDDKHKDLTWTIDSRGVEYSIVADGFSPDDKISLISDGERVYTIPFDWSGRIELPMMLIIEKDTKACIEINEGGKIFGACNMITGKKAA